MNPASCTEMQDFFMGTGEIDEIYGIDGLMRMMEIHELNHEIIEKGAFPLSGRVGKTPFFAIYNNVGIIIPNTEKRYSRYPLRGGWSQQTYQR